MSEQEVIEQLNDYGDWLTGTIAADVRPTGVQLLETGSGDFSPLEQEQVHRDSRIDLGPRSGLVLAAVFLAVAAIGWIVLSRSNVVEQPAVLRGDLVLPGETVIQDDPLIVAAAFGPEPQFDTSELGDELVWEPVLEIDEQIEQLIALADLSFDGEERTSVKVTILGRLLGEPWIISVSDGPRPEEMVDRPELEIMRRRNIFSGDGLVGSGELISEGSRIFIDPSHGEMGGIGNSQPVGWLKVGRLPEGTAAIALEDSDQKLWVRSRGDVAFLPAQFDIDETVTVTAYAVDGSVLGTSSVVESYYDDSIGTNPIGGQSMAGSQAIDVDTGAAVTIGGNGKPSVLVMGATWCQPCANFEQTILLLESLGESVNVYGVSHYNDPNYSDEPWPPFNSWTFPRVELVDNPASSVGFVPAVLVLDEQDKLIALLDDIDTLEADLVRLGIAPG